MLTMARDLINPRTRQATAFYAALAVTVYDVVTRGFHLWSALILASAAGLTAAGIIGAMMHLGPPPE